MNIKVTADSTCDLSADILEEYNIAITPLTVIKAGTGYIDGVTITPAEIFAHVAAGGDLCSTSAVSVGEYQEHFTKYAGEYDGVIHICISSDFSSTYRHACIAAEDFENVRVVDSRNLSTGQGLVVLKACELAKTAASLDELKRELDDFTSRVEASFLVDRLDYLVSPREVAAHRHEVHFAVERRLQQPQVAPDLQEMLVREGLVNRNVVRPPAEMGRGRGFYACARRTRHRRHVRLVLQQPRGAECAAQPLL